MFDVCMYTMFGLHWIGMCLGPFCWVWFPRAWIVYAVVALSWKLNQNRCLVTQLEHALFAQTFLGKDKFHVPTLWRYTLYANTCMCVLYNFVTV